MKKVILIKTLIILSILLLAACQNELAPAEPTPQSIEATPSPDADTPDDTEEIEILPEDAGNNDYDQNRPQISLAYDALLDSFDYLYEFDYTILREARAGGPAEVLNGYSFIIWSDAPMRDFSVISIGNDSINEELFFIPIDSFGHVDEILPGQAFAIHSYVGVGTLSWSGITFVDDDGKRQYFRISPEPARFEPDIFDLDISDQFENGVLQVSLIGNGGLLREFTIVHDESEPFDPHEWTEENRHIWITFSLIPFENRVAELPEDWVPWWGAVG